MKLQSVKSELWKLFMLLVAAFVSFTSLYVFVIPSNFSPSGIDGISTILYEITGINIGWFKIAFNIPLLILAWIYLKRRYVVYVVLFTMLDSFGVIVLEEINFFTFIPAGLSDADAVGYRLIAAIFAGVALGVATAIMLKLDCSTGGVDIVSCLVNLKKPNFHVERVTSIICYCVIGCSYFVYWDLTSILLSVIQIFVYECTVSSILRKERYALEVKFITKEPEKIRDEILYKHQHSATILKGTGMYTGDEYFMVVTVINSRDIAQFMNTMKQHPDTFVYFSDGVKVQGDFHFGDKIGERINAY